MAKFGVTVAKRRIVRRLFNLAAAASLAFAAAIAMLMVSQVGNISYAPPTPSTTIGPVHLGLNHQKIYIWHGNNDAYLNGVNALIVATAPASTWSTVRWQFRIADSLRGSSHAFALGSLSGNLILDTNVVTPLGQFRLLGHPQGETWTLGLYMLPWLLLFSLLPAAWLGDRLIRRYRRWPAGHCQACGYDLRGSPGDCPECGRPRAIVHATPPSSSRE